MESCCDNWEEEVRYWKYIPKIELHAHLNGCVRSSTLLELSSEQGKIGGLSKQDIEGIINDGNRSLSECFKLFPLIHALTTDHSTVTRITKEAIEDFAADNVVYLELRTTPKNNEAYGMTKRSYVEAVLAGFQDAGAATSLGNPQKEILDETRTQSARRGSNSDVKPEPCLFVQLLLSIDRKESGTAAMDTVRLAWEMRDSGVVGVDLSGDPNTGNWQTFLPALKWAREHGLFTTLHCGEIFNSKEVNEMLTFGPHRLGHVCCLEKDEMEVLLKSKIPVEVCLTSNYRTLNLGSFLDHHFGMLHETSHPIIICTDDPGVFSTCLSHEFSLLRTYFDISSEEILRMEEAAIDYTFAEENIKTVLRKIFNAATESFSQ